MAEQSNGEVIAFLTKVEGLLCNFEKWAAEEGLKTARKEHTISEESLGEYRVPVLMIGSQQGKQLVEVVPIGTRVIGANGRIDVKGTIDSAILIDLEEGGPKLTSSITAGGQTSETTTEIFRGISQAGWYWVERTARAKGHFMDKEEFLDLLSDVSDYERA